MKFEDLGEEHYTTNILAGYGWMLTVLVLERDVINRLTKLGDFVAGLARNLLSLTVSTCGIMVDWLVGLLHNVVVLLLNYVCLRKLILQCIVS